MFWPGDVAVLSAPQNGLIKHTRSSTPPHEDGVQSLPLYKVCTQPCSRERSCPFMRPRVSHSRFSIQSKRRVALGWRCCRRVHKRADSKYDACIYSYLKMGAGCTHGAPFFLMSRFLVSLASTGRRVYHTTTASQKLPPQLPRECGVGRQSR